MWQPIETAPQTGPAILISDGAEVWEADFNPHLGYWPERYEGDNRPPTHWMPMPAPPIPKNPPQP